jgi:hypothetical protein
MEGGLVRKNRCKSIHDDPNVLQQEQIKTKTFQHPASMDLDRDDVVLRVP